MTLRPELTPLPDRLRRLVVDRRGYPVPWFVPWIDGQPEFRAMAGEKLVQAVREKRCWICGDTLGVHLTFLLGPMCAVNRTIAEPPSHYACAQWSAINCPFLTRPHMVRREDDVINADTFANDGTAGEAILRNPGAIAVWVTKRFQIFNDGHGKPLFEVGDPERVEWYAHGRRALRAEVVASIESGLPLLTALCEKESSPARQQDARAQLTQQRAAVDRLLPVED